MIMQLSGGAPTAELFVQMKRSCLTDHTRNAGTGLRRKTLSSGCSGYLFMLKDYLKVSMISTGLKGSRRCSETGSAVPQEQRLISGSTEWMRS